MPARARTCPGVRCAAHGDGRMAMCKALGKQLGVGCYGTVPYTHIMGLGPEGA